MKKIAVLFYCLWLSTLIFGQTKVYHSVEEAMAVPADSVFHIDLSKQKLTVFPQEILKLTHLKTLDISRNKLTKIPDEIKGLKNLVSVNFEKNNLVYFPVGICSILPLETVNLGRNNIGIVPECIGQMKNLKTLDFWDNPISDLPTSIQNLESLVVMDLRGINFSNSKKKQISALVPWVKIEFSKGCDCSGP